MIEIKSTKANFGINFPTSINEITTDVLTKLTADVKLPKHYAIVALCFKTRLFDLVTMVRTNKETEISVISMLAKINEEDSIFTVGEKLIIDRSSLERGNQLSLNTVISSNVARNYFKEDKDLIQKIISDNDGIYKNVNLILLEFKIVPVCDIKGAIPVVQKINDPYIVLDNTKVN